MPSRSARRTFSIFIASTTAKASPLRTCCPALTATEDNSPGIGDSRKRDRSGGAFSGTDPTKVDRSAASAARYLAKNVVGAALAERCIIQLSYAIGVAKPLSVYVDTQGTGQVDEDKLSKVLQQIMDLSPRGIREHLGLNKPIYARTAAYGHFGRQPASDGGFSWERLDLVDSLKSALS